MSIQRIGPVSVTQFNPTVSWISTPDARGLRAASIGGALTWTVAQQLAELVDNPARRVTFAGEVGVPEFVFADDSLLSPFSGLYLLQSFQVSATYEDSLSGLDGAVGFTLAALLIGTAGPVVVHSARPVESDLAPTSEIADPFPGLGASSSFVRSPGGTRYTREFDPLPHDPARIAAPAASMEVYVGNITTTTDDLAAVTEIALEGL